MNKKSPIKSNPDLSPETQEMMRQLVRQELAQLLSPIFEVAGMQVIAPGQNRFVLNPEARRILEMDHDTLMLRIRSGDLVDGIHFQGRGRRRSWRPDRLERYRATEGDELQRLKDIAQWEREGFGAA
jgi:hypothetical protein